MAKITYKVNLLNYEGNLHRAKSKNVHYEDKIITFLSIRRREHKSLQNDENLFFLWMNNVGGGGFLL